VSSITPNLRLRLSENLTADARYNLERIDLVGSIVQLDDSQSAAVASLSSINLLPNAPSKGGSGSGGTVYVGSASQLSNLLVYGTITGDLSGSATSFTGPLLGDIIGTQGATAIAPGVIVNGDINAAAAIAGSKISPVFTGLVESGPQGFLIRNGSYSTSLLPGNSQLADVSLKLPITDGLPNQVLTTDGSGNLSFSSPGAGTVTSVGLVLPAMFTVSNSPVTLSGDLTAVLATQSAKAVLAGPVSGAAAVPTFRQLSADDLTDGSTNRFYSDSLFAISLSTRTTTNLAEGTNEYHTTARARTAAVVNSTAGTETDQAPSVSSIKSYIAGLTTSDIAEGTNLYHTDLRAQDAAGALVADTATAQLDYISGTSFSVTVLPQGLINSVSGIAESGGILSVSPVDATAKTTPIATDILLIADSASSNALKKITLADIVTLAGNGFSDTWVSGTTKAVAHGLGTRNVMVEVFDNVTYETVYLDSVVRTDTNTVTLTASVAPSGSGLTVLVKRIA
jgi:hypothetical protein